MIVAIVLLIIFSIWLAGTADSRVTDKHQPGCNTYKCDKRMEKKNHKKTIKRWKKDVKPYRVWLEKVGRCETRGYSRRASYSVNTGNGFYGRYQFDYRSWRSAGGTTQYAHQAEPIEQDYRAVRWLQMVGRRAWPVCG